MYQNKFIDLKQFNEAKKLDIIILKRDPKEFYIAEDFTEEVRKFLNNKYGSKTLYKKGLSVRSTVNTFYQNEAYKALRWGIEEYDKRHGWRGSLDNIGNDFEKIFDYNYIKNLPTNWKLGVVEKRQEKNLMVLLKNKQKINIKLSKNNSWINIGLVYEKVNGINSYSNLEILLRLHFEWNNSFHY